MAGATAGYSGTPLATKLGVKPGHVVLLDRLPHGLDLGLPPSAHLVRRLRGGLDVTVTFHTRLATLAERLPAVCERTVSDGMVWVAWPKQAAVKRLGIDTDLNENVVRELGLGIGWVDVKVAAIDETWSGLKFVRRLVDR
ncbi:MAG TPA: DUF3052 domain-containing protein [Nocardioides sp.]|uniref:DUF3052 domain-containing protein n=1 Tax=Nocardioides sp. TaxID=35761 RepID=UPI002F41CF8B